MNPHNLPVFTKFTDCQDCYKCVRECPVKAIKIEDYHASIIPELCIHCGHCVEICPVQAKKVRDDLTRVKAWLKAGKEIYVSLAPSWIVEFPQYRDSEMIECLNQIGFKAVSETALGAEEVNSAMINLLANQQQFNISSACPVVTSLLSREFPGFCDNIIPLESPLIAHCRLLRKLIPAEAFIVFIGPCIAKKVEADEHPELLNASITFKDLMTVLSESSFKVSSMNVEKEFFPYSAKEGSIYPVDGGMSAGIRENCQIVNQNFVTISGIKNIIAGLRNFDPAALKSPLFLELMACEGGCINGPGCSREVSYLQKRMELITRHQEDIHPTRRVPQQNIARSYPSAQKLEAEPSEQEILDVFHSIGKYEASDQLNCGSCGYNSCRDFAKAVLGHKAERGMCVSYLRKRAQKKANALFSRMPAGAVIVNAQMQIVEANANFLKVLELDDYIFNEEQGFAGVFLQRLIPFSDLFQQVISTGEDILDKEYKFQGTILKLSIFTIEKHHLVGGIIQDITEPSVMREQTITKARKVIGNNLNMVQQVAYLLGENAAELETTLNSIIEVSDSGKLSDLSKR